ncbi:hypothetical protein BgAZ_203120 [Babesia gibsoni]|uniref:Uncharacterized protein n=1 Tax=Babesia gibsoni TaxID=33632 RepID=A0AAD8LQH4_BABGI|nr:hypothetical protein BgAZ_203120 [Babesia gibsoni]
MAGSPKEGQETPEVEIQLKEKVVKEQRLVEELQRVVEPPKKRGYAILDLHLNQFLSFIAEDYSFLPCAIYRPRIDVYLNNRLVYKSRVLAHNDDTFGNTVRLHIKVPNSVLTLKLYECVQLRLTEACVDELIRPILKDQPMDEALISWCDIELGLLVPHKTYDVVCAFRVNTMFREYNPGGLLYYPTIKGKPFIDSKRVCCACRVCVMLASHTPLVHKSMLNKYFDFRCVVNDIEVPKKPPVESSENDSDDPKRMDSKSSEGTDEDGSKAGEGNKVGSPVESPQKVVVPAEHMKYGDESTLEEADPDDKVETFEMNVKKIFFTKEGCTCCRLADIPNHLRGVNYSPCLCCHDYQVCCEHSVENYYYASVTMKLASKTTIDFKTELMALVNNPIPINPAPDANSDSLCSIANRIHELYDSINMLNQHIGFSGLSGVHQKYLYVCAMLLLICFVFEGQIITVSCLLLGILSLYLKATSNIQFHRDWGDVIQVSKRSTASGKGLEKLVQDMIEEDEASKIVEPVSRYKRNMPYIPKHEFVDKVKVYSKVNTSLNRHENIALKTVTSFLSSSVPRKLRKAIVSTLNFCDGIVWYLNAILAILRWYGVVICLFFFGLGVVSIRYAFWIKCFVKSVIIITATSSLMGNHPMVRLFYFQFKNLIDFIAMRIRRKEWFLNVEAFP